MVNPAPSDLPSAERKGKHAGHDSMKLVTALAALIVSALNHLSCVPSFSLENIKMD